MTNILMRKSLTRKSHTRKGRARGRVVRKRPAVKKVSVMSALKRFCKRLFTLLFALLVFAVFAALTFGLYETVVTHPYFSIKTVEISGTQNLSSQKLLEVISPLLAGNIFTCDIKSATTYLEKNRWVESVSIRRRLPDSIVVELTERKPIAAMLADSGKRYLIDRHGFLLEEISQPGKYVLLTGFPGSTNGGLPGVRISEKRLLEDALKISSIFSGNAVLADPIASIDVSNPDRITARTAVSDTLIRFGPERDEWEEKFLEYVTARKILLETSAKFSEIDLSFNNQVVVGRGVRRMEGGNL